MLRVAIADDEPPARKNIQRLLAERDGIGSIIECRDGKEVVSTLASGEVDLMFLDIQMPYLTGLEALQRAPTDGTLPLIIFTTAYKEHALDAFDLEAVDYLLKPWTKERFNKALDLALKRHQERSSPAPKDPPRDMQFTIRDGSDIQVVKSSEIRYIESAGNYVLIYTEEQKYIHRETLSSLTEKLEPMDFFRASRGYLINLSSFHGIGKNVDGKSVIHLSCGSEIPLRRTLRELRDALDAVGAPR